jgi:dTDP-glucose 4,6-dehydratase
LATWLVTGGAGFIGANFVRLALTETEHQVVVLDALTYAGHRESLAEFASDERLVFVEGDIADRGAVSSVFRTYPPDAVLNFAAESHVDRSIDGPRIFVRTNIAGTLELLEACREHLKADASRTERFRFLHVSTDEVFGSLPAEGLFRETTPYAPRSPYAASKAGADHLVHAYYETYGLPVLLTNCSNNYGPYQFPEKLIPLTILNALEGRPLPIYGDGQNVRDWLYVEDHCRALVRVLEAGEVGHSYNVGGRSERTNLALVDALCDALETAHPAAKNPKLADAGVARYSELKTFVEDRPGHDRRYAIDPSRIETELGWRPRVDLEAGLARTVAWYLANRGWCDSVQAHGYRRERLGLSQN